jgi:pSer/pThr/pTyr-binding forkhead associated (FHA) protein
MSSDEAFTPQLLIEHTGQTFPLTEGEITIGGGEDNTIILADPQVSAAHARITYQAETGTYQLEDLGSSEGTFVNERRVEGAQPLRHGDVIRTGATVIDVQLEGAGLAPVAAAPLAADAGEKASSQHPVLIGILIASLIGITILCGALAIALLLGGGGAPDVVINAPADNSQYAVNSEVLLQASASGVNDIVLIDLMVDDVVVASSASPEARGTSSLTVSEAWTFTTAGSHVVSAVAYNSDGDESRPASVTVDVVDAGGTLPTSTATPEAEDTAVPTETPTPLPGAPQIEYFRANPQSINAGDCTTLEWGQVVDATDARIEPDVGGVGTPGRTTVCPTETTTYILTASGPGGETEASTEVQVSVPQADLLIDSIQFQPNPPVQGEETEVKITIRNQGVDAASPFDWEFAPGSESPIRDRVDNGLDAGDSIVVTARWTPANAYASVKTVARVDINNEVSETDKNNNELSAVIQVLEGTAGSGTVTSTSNADLDGYRSNDGSGSRNQDVLQGNGEFSSGVGELIWRGLMSFDLSEVPAGATIDSVELRFYQVKVDGNPYSKLGGLVLEHVDYGNRLSADAFDTPALGSMTLSSQQNPGTWYTVSGPTLASWVQDSVNAGRDSFQVRLRWLQESDGDGEEDYVGVESGNNFFGSGNLPQVIIVWSQ